MPVEVNEASRSHAKGRPPEREALSGGQTFAGEGLLSLGVVTIKPLADAVGRCICCDHHQKINEDIHVLTPFLLSGIGRTAGTL